MPLLYLALHVLFGSGFSLGVKSALVRKTDLLVVGGLNYLVAFAVATPWLFLRGGAEFGWSGGIFGATMGITYFIAYFFLIYAVRHQGLAATAAVGQLSVLVPIVFSVLLWGELPSHMQFAGLVIAGAAIALLDARRDMLAELTGRLRWNLLGFFVTGGVARLAAKAFAETGSIDERAFYLWMVYACAGTCSVVMLVRHRRLPKPEEWFWGAFVGICNITQVMFMLRALEHLPGIVVFPISACGTIIIAGAVAVLLLGERPTLRLYLGITTSAIAVALLNWRGPDAQ